MFSTTTLNASFKECRKMDKQLRIGFVGARRSCGFLTAFNSHPQTRVAAVCDLLKDRAEETAKPYDAEVYTDYETMLDKGKLDAVVIATPMNLHVPQSILALDRNVSVLSEVPAAVSIAESKQLVQVATQNKAVYMMAENYAYMKPNVLIGEMVKAGLFGETYFFEGEYIHELKELNETTPWRRKWQTGINGCTYGTHSLGPILQWLGDQRVVEVSCVGTGHHYRDPRGDEYEQEDSTLMLCRLSGGGLAKIRVDMLSDRPHAQTNYALQGTLGAYESDRTEGEKNRVWIKGLSKEKDVWDNLEIFEEKYLPDFWKNPPEEAKEAGHGGGDYFEVVDFVNAVLGKSPCPIDIHRAMDLTLPGLVSQESIVQSGKWLEVPDSRSWV
jgi:predicted dehydrogenase